MSSPGATVERSKTATHLGRKEPFLLGSAWRAMVAGCTIGFPAVLWLNVLHHAAGATEVHEPQLVWHTLRDGTLALPIVVIAVLLAAQASSRLALSAPELGRLGGVVSGALTGFAVALALALGSVVHEQLFVGAHHASTTPLHLLQHLLVSLVVTVPLGVVTTARLP
jgi:hypothetical protein